MIEVTTKRCVIRGVPQAWEKQYGQRKEAVLRKLTELNLETATEDDIADIIGNRSWTAMRCDACGSAVDLFVTIGQPRDEESSTASVCVGCLSNALKLAKRFEKAA